MRAQTTYRDTEEDLASERISLADDANPLAASVANRGGLFTYLGTMLSTLVQELSRHPAKESFCSICSDAMHPTQVAVENEGKPVHALCLEMKVRKHALLRSVKSQEHSCSLCGQKVPPAGIYFHEAGLTLSYTCAEPAHDEPNLFSFPVTTDESKRVGTWEARLRERLKEKGYVRCCECGRLIRAAAAQLFGPGWHYCGCLPDLWRTGP